MVVIEKKPQKEPPPRSTDPEVRVYGRKAVDALYQSRPADIIRVYVEEPLVNEYGPMLKWCSRRKLAYHVVTRADLNKISKSVHHEGIMLLARAANTCGDNALITSLVTTTGPVSVIFLDGVGNPHNVGALARVAAHFGVRFIAGDATSLPQASPSMARIAEGGLEHVTLVRLENPKAVLTQLANLGFAIIGTSSHSTDSLFRTPLPEKAVFVLGSEINGISREITNLCTRTVAIPGTGVVESLNVSVACGLVLGEYARQHQLS